MKIKDRKLLYIVQFFLERVPKFSSVLSYKEFRRISQHSLRKFPILVLLHLLSKSLVSTYSTIPAYILDALKISFSKPNIDDYFLKYLLLYASTMAGEVRLELTTYGFRDRRSSQLRYSPVFNIKALYIHYLFTSKNRIDLCCMGLSLSYIYIISKFFIKINYISFRTVLIFSLAAITAFLESTI